MALEAELAGVIVGQRNVVRGVLTALLAGGHVLLEGVPGLGKTLLVRTLAESGRPKATRRHRDSSVSSGGRTWPSVASESTFQMP